VAGRHTPPCPVAVEVVFPELAPLAVETVRLHPRAGEPGGRDSPVGGPLLWPAEEPWPTCPEHGYHEHDIAEAVPFVAVVQVFRADAPGTPFPPNTDVLQVLWCPNGHDHLYCGPESAGVPPEFACRRRGGHRTPTGRG